MKHDTTQHTTPDFSHYDQLAQEIGQKHRYYQSGVDAVKELLEELFARRVINTSEHGIADSQLRMILRKLDTLEEIQWRDHRP